MTSVFLIDMALEMEKNLVVVNTVMKLVVPPKYGKFLA